MDFKEDKLHEREKLISSMDINHEEVEQKQLLYFDHTRIRHMERMFDLFLTLFKRR
ncbi:MAG: hypothetical protein OEV78_03825 [Spirochaetia bacterium]|nr:hypothetical protein [Spirochaetia bacterium]